MDAILLDAVALHRVSAARWGRSPASLAGEVSAAEDEGAHQRGGYT